jgi:hypothetical protein
MDIKSKNTIRLILIHHRQNPTKMTDTEVFDRNVTVPSGEMRSLFVYPKETNSLVADPKPLTKVRGR